MKQSRRDIQELESSRVIHMTCNSAYCDGLSALDFLEISCRIRSETGWEIERVILFCRWLEDKQFERVIYMKVILIQATLPSSAC